MSDHAVTLHCDCGQAWRVTFSFSEEDIPEHDCSVPDSGGLAKDAFNRGRLEGTATERAHIVALAWQEADGYAATLRETDPCGMPVDGAPCDACIVNEARVMGARDALMELVAKVEGET